MKGCKMECAYLIKSGQGYYCHESHLFGGKKEMATRFLSRRKARMIAKKMHGQIKKEILTPTALQAIIEVQEGHSHIGASTRQVLDKIYNISEKIYDYMSLTIGGKHTDNLRELQFTAAGRYADIYHVAHCMIKSYYDIVASNQFYAYDPELDGRGMAELEINMLLGEMFEQQIYNLAILERDAREYLRAAFTVGNPQAANRFSIILDLFSEKIVKEYETDPEKCFHQYMDIIEKYL